MHRITRVSLLAGLLALGHAATAAGDVGNPPLSTNVVYGFVNSNATMTVAAPGPIYYVVGDLIVNSGATLTIQPGVTVRFSANRDTLGGGDYPSQTELRVRGQLIAQGTLADSIRFLSTDDGFAEWGQIKVDAGGTAFLRHSVVKGASVGIRHSSNTLLTLSDLLIRDCGNAVSIESGTFTARWLVVENCNGGLMVANGATGTLQTSRITGRGVNFGGTGITVGSGVDMTPPDTGLVAPIVVSDYYYGVVLSGGSIRNVLTLRNNVGVYGNGIVDYCTAAANGHGFQLSGIVSNSIAASNGYGVEGNCGGLTARYVDAWGNSTNFQGCGFFALQNAESLNPFFVAPQLDDYRLSGGSVFESFSSSGGQIGAYGPHRGPNIVNVTGPGGASSLSVLVAPNPTRGRTRFTRSEALSGDAVLEIIDLNGRRVRRIGASASQGDWRTVTWDGLDERGVKATQGVYYWRLTTTTGTDSGRLVVIE